MRSTPIKISVKILKRLIREALESSETDTQEERPESSEKRKEAPVAAPGGDSRGDAIEAFIAIFDRIGAPSDYSLSNEEDPPDHHRPIATMLVDKVRQYTDKSVYRVRFKISKDAIKATADDKVFAKINLKDFENYVRKAVKNATKEDPWGEIVMDYDWSRIV